MAQRSTNAVATISSAEIAQETTFSPRQVDLIRDQLMPGASPEDLMLFAQVASHRGLDPFAKHIYAVSRKTKNADGQWVDKWSYQVSIDGLRLIAQRSGRYEGQTPAEWCGEDGVWTDIWLRKEPPAAARVGVYIKGNRAPLYAVALWDNFVQRTKEGAPTKFWNEMGPHMLAKCAEAQALRKGFPEEMGGLYTREEMAQASNPTQVERIDRVTGEIVETKAQLNSADDERKQEAARLWYMARDTFGWDQATLDQVSVHETGKHLAELDVAGIKDLYRALVVTSPDARAELLATIGNELTQKAG
jgi:phage recombination protein Bet